MERAVTYSVVERVDPREPEVAGKYYATAQARGVMGIREMAERIQHLYRDASRYHGGTYGTGRCGE